MTVPLPVRPPAGRYGREPDPRTRRRGVVALWALGALGLVMALWLGVGAARTPVTWEDVGFTLDGSRGVEVDFDVIRQDPSIAVRCRLQALNHQYAEVGALEVAVPPATERAVRLAVDVATSQAAVTGIVDRCWVP